jgi:hypothetical protein
VWFTHPNSINEIHRGRLRVSVITKCLDAVKMYGNSPRKLFIMISINSLINKIVLPEKASVPRRVLNSACNFLVIDVIIILVLLGTNQKTGVIIIVNNIALAQFNGREILEEGSKTENKFVIIIFN